MGKGPQRKKTDQPKIRISQTINTTPTNSSGGAGVSADKCPVTLQAKLHKSALTVNNAPVELEKSGERYEITIGGRPVGTLDLRISKTITNCSDLGIRYKGKIVVEKEIAYARFQRLS